VRDDHLRGKISKGNATGTVIHKVAAFAAAAFFPA
jgi:hypothetical protein